MFGSSGTYRMPQSRLSYAYRLSCRKGRQERGITMRKNLAILLSFVLLGSGCSAQSAEPVRSDMSGYQYLEDEEHVFTDWTVEDFLQALDDQETFTAYFGFSSCPWCNEAVPILNEAARESGVSWVYYIDTRADSSWTSNMDITDYDLLVERVGSYFPYDDDGYRHLYTPFVFFVKDGEVVATHEGTLEGQDASEERLTEEEQQELLQIYLDDFALLQ